MMLMPRYVSLHAITPLLLLTDICALRVFRRAPYAASATIRCCCAAYAYADTCYAYMPLLPLQCFSSAIHAATPLLRHYADDAVYYAFDNEWRLPTLRCHAMLASATCCHAAITPFRYADVAMMPPLRTPL